MSGVEIFLSSGFGALALSTLVGYGRLQEQAKQTETNYDRVRDDIKDLRKELQASHSELIAILINQSRGESDGKHSPEA